MQGLADRTPRRSTLSRIKAAVPIGIKARLLRKDGLRPIDASIWDAEFAAGRWDFLGGASEMPRYAVIAGYFARSPSNRSVLDVGCGNGVLQPWLARVGYDRYVGSDLSAAAIEQAQALAGPATLFEVADANGYVPAQPADVIVLNEMLYYLHDPVAELRRYAQFLNPGGSFVISLWECKEGWRAWRKIRHSIRLLDETRVERNGLAWHVRLCQP